jgi:hypothetical protein
MSTPAIGPWTKYAQQSAEGPWTKYAKPLPGLSPENLAANKARNAQPTQFERDNAMSPNERQANEFLLGAASGGSGLPETLHPIQDAAAASQPQTIGQAAKRAAVSAPGFGLLSSLYNAGKQIIAPPSASGEDPNEQRAHGLGTLAGMAGSALVGEGVEGAGRGTGAALSPYKSQIASGAEALQHPSAVPGKIVTKLTDLIPDTPETAATKQLTADAAAMRTRNLQARVAESKAADAAGQTVPEYRASIKAAAKAKVSPPTAETNAAGVAAPSADVIKVPVPRALQEGEKVGYNASTPRRLVLDNALQGRPGAAEMLRNMGKTPLFVEEGGYAPPKERISFGNVSDPGDFTGQAAQQPRYAYRAHTAGEPEIDLNRPAHATLSREEAEQIAQHRNGGLNQVVSPIDLNTFAPEHIEESPGPRSANWVKFKRQLSAKDYGSE